MHTAAARPHTAVAATRRERVSGRGDGVGVAPHATDAGSWDTIADYSLKREAQKHRSASYRCGVGRRAGAAADEEAVFFAADGPSET